MTRSLRRWLFLLLPLSLFAPRGEAACTLFASTVTPVLFGIYDPQSATPLDSTGLVTVTCGVGLIVSYEIRIDTGGSGSFSPRRMSSGSHTLEYNLYTNSTRTTIWGDGSGGTGTQGFSGLLTLTGLRTFTIYGRVFTGQSVPGGSYNDTLTVTIEY